MMSKMPIIQVKMEELEHRGEYVRQLLKPIAKRSSGPAWQRKSSVGEFIIGTHDGSPIRSDYRDWRFTSVVHNFQAMYFEIWRRSEVKEKEYWYLYRAYLSIYQIDRGQQKETEFLCLHCDPNEADNAPHAIYKRGPHLHINVANHPIPHAHIALNRCHLEEVLNSVNSLTEALKLAIQMLKDEILDALYLPY
jgi:hypothetical protein